MIIKLMIISYLPKYNKTKKHDIVFGIPIKLFINIIKISTLNNVVRVISIQS